MDHIAQNVLKMDAQVVVTDYKVAALNANPAIFYYNLQDNVFHVDSVVKHVNLMKLL